MGFSQAFNSQHQGVGGTDQVGYDEHHVLSGFDFWPFAAPTGHEVNSEEPPSPSALLSPLKSAPHDSCKAHLSGQDVDDGSVTSDSSAVFEIRRSKNVYVELPRSTLVNPRSFFDGFTPPYPPTKERHALASLMRAVEAQGFGASAGFIEFELTDFSFYNNQAHSPFEMRPLQHLATRVAHNRFYFDGVLSFGKVSHYVRQVEFAELPIGNYGTSHASVDGQIWVRSQLNAHREVYYRLGKPGIEYERYYAPFLWAADLAKHVVDYSASMIEHGHTVNIHSFKEHFIRWLLKHHYQSPDFQKWRRRHPSDDYRTSVAANIHFIWKEMNGVLGWNKAHSLQLFRETLFFNEYRVCKVPSVPMIVRGDQKVAPTTVTPYIKECFGHMVIGSVLKVVGTASAANATRNSLKGAADPKGGLTALLPPKFPSTRGGQRSRACYLPTDVIDKIKVGDTISTPRDDENTDTEWRPMASKNSAEDHRWFCLVQKVHIAKDGSRSFDVTWFYRPSETPCCMMKYPWSNELFLSDHCTCEEEKSHRVKEHEILAVHDIDWFGSPGSSKEFFVRQYYMVQDRRWVTLRRSHMTCSHGRPKLGFRTGDTVLAALSTSSAFTEPYEVVKIFKQDKITFVRLRKLLRRQQVDPRAGAAPNELVYTDQLVVTKPEKITGKCLVRFFRSGEPIPSPYNRGGTGNLFYVTHKLGVSEEDGSYRCIPFDGDFPASLRQGFDPTDQPFRKLRGMDLFCGSGNFGRGLEDGGAVEMVWANDIWEKAIHTYMANSRDPKSTKPFLGSVDDLLRFALEGKFSDKVPRPGEVDFISAGSPCPGFSLLTADKTTLVQIKNQSLVASFASFVDFYRPKYGILENVATIVQARHNRSEDTLSQLFCAIVGMGYQAQLILGDAWSHGAPQSRTRVFLYFAAPGLQLPEAPMLSHSHYPKATGRGLGEMCNREPFVSRSFQLTPFKYVSAAEGTADLPRIDDGKAEPSIAFPDHRVCGGITEEVRQQIRLIPTHPYGMKFAKAWNEGKGVMTPAERELFPKKGARVSPISRGWARIRPGDVIATVTTSSQPTDARAPTQLHWCEDRPLTVQEVRRAQGFPDDEVLLGLRADQWKLVGNSVARQMALALGLKFREAWVGTLYEDGRISREASSEAASSSRAATAPLTGDWGKMQRQQTAAGGTAQNGRRGSSSCEVVQPTSGSRSASRSSTERGDGCAGGPPSAVLDSVEVPMATAAVSVAIRGGNGGGGGSSSSNSSSSSSSSMRKRVLSQTLAAAAEWEMRSPKSRRLSGSGSGRSSPALVDDGQDSLSCPRMSESAEPRAEAGSGSDAGAPVVDGAEREKDGKEEVEGAEEEEEDVTPVKTGPTVVRLLSPDEMGS